MQTPGAPVRVVMLDGATHAFDEREARDIRTRHDPAITLRAHDLLKTYLREALARAPKVLRSREG
jgi:dienelactone hydrolase